MTQHLNLLCSIAQGKRESCNPCLTPWQALGSVLLVTSGQGGVWPQRRCEDMFVTMRPQKVGFAPEMSPGSRQLQNQVVASRQKAAGGGFPQGELVFLSSEIS